jgi:hypothetical protein
MAASIASRAVYSLSLHAHTIKSKPEVDSVVAIKSELSTAFGEESRRLKLIVKKSNLSYIGRYRSARITAEME